jgi:hypothetical protein
MHHSTLCAMVFMMFASSVALVLAAHFRNLALIAAELIVIAAGLTATVTLIRVKNSVKAADRLRVHGPEGDDLGPHNSGDSSQSDYALNNKQWMKLVEEIVVLIEELARHRSNLDSLARELADHVILRLEEILERSGVGVIANEAMFERSRHEPEKGTTYARPGDAIFETIRPGLAVGRRVLRRAVVRLAKSEPGTESTTST